MRAGRFPGRRNCTMSTTAKERHEVRDRLYRIGIDFHDVEKLRRIAMQLHNWHEKECGTDHGCIERDETTGKAYWLNSTTMKRYPIRDMETKALARLETMMKEKYPDLIPYVQTDPRGASVYILTKKQLMYGGMKIEQLDSIYSRGTAVY